MNAENIQYDVIVIGGGPAGMMAAGRAAECGARVLLLEKNEDLGKKLLITGGGRCNMTNTSPDMLERFGATKKFLFSPFSRFGVADTLRFFHDRKVSTKTEEGGRVFPASDQAQSVWGALSRYMDEGKVKVRCSVFVKGFETEGDRITGVRVGASEVLRASSYVLATGGLSHPETGSTGDGFRFLEGMGHAVRQPEPSLVPIRIHEHWVQALSGYALEDATLAVFQGGKKRFVRRGKMLFTHFGLSGPAVLNMSREAKELAKKGKVEIVLDLLPGKDQGAIDTLLQEAFAGHGKKHVGNLLGTIIPARLSAVVLRFAGVEEKREAHAVTREERLAIGRSLRHLPMTVAGFLGADKAIITSGGLSPKEVDFSSMRSRKYSNLYVVGDILDIDRPSGGYSLQLCWTTGYIAGESAAVMEEKKSA